MKNNATGFVSLSESQILDLEKVTLKDVVKLCHISEPKEHVMPLLGCKYPTNEQEFERSGLSGTFDPSKAGKRMKLEQPQTWERLISKHGNQGWVWEDLIRENRLSYLALLRNLRNILNCGVHNDIHDKILKRIQSESLIVKAKIFPYQILAAYDTLCEMRESLQPEAMMDGNRSPEEIIPLNSNILRRYLSAVDNAIKASIAACVQPIRGRTVIFVDVSRSMHARLSPNSSLRVGSLVTIQQVACLMSLLLYYLCEEAEVYLIGSRNSLTEKPYIRVPVDLNNHHIVTQIDKMMCFTSHSLTVAVEFPYEFFEEELEKIHDSVDGDKIDTAIFISDSNAYDIMEYKFNHVHQPEHMQGSNKYLNGYTPREILARYRKKVNPEMVSVSVDLAGQDSDLDNKMEVAIDKSNAYVVGYLQDAFTNISKAALREL